MPQFTCEGGSLAIAHAEDIPLLLASRLAFPLLGEGPRRSSLIDLRVVAREDVVTLSSESKNPHTRAVA
jgi:hypothetical protein